MAFILNSDTPIAGSAIVSGKTKTALAFSGKEYALSFGKGRRGIRVDGLVIHIEEQGAAIVKVDGKPLALSAQLIETGDSQIWVIHYTFYPA